MSPIVYAPGSPEPSCQTYQAQGIAFFNARAPGLTLFPATADLRFEQAPTSAIAWPFGGTGTASWSLLPAE